MAAKPLLFLIDGSSQMYRAFHAPIRTTDGTFLRDAQGRPTNAVYIFVTMLRKLFKDHSPQFIGASFDLPGRTFRDDLAADYKANRAPMPDDLAAQIPLVHRACEALGVPILTHDRYEADDVIGTMTARAAAEGYDVAIVTGDKDFFQLVRDGIRVFNPREEGSWYDAAGVQEKFGVRPDQVVDALALMGDTIDNVKGVPGIGEKGARELISTYGSLDALLEHAAKVPQKRYREALLAHAPEARSSRQLLEIHTDVPVEFNIDRFRYLGADRAACFRLFSDLGFRSLVTEFAPTAETIEKNYQLIRTRAELIAVVEELRLAGRFGVRVLPDSPAAVRAGIAGIALSSAPRTAWYLPLRKPVIPGMPVEAPRTWDLLDEEPAAPAAPVETGLAADEALEVLKPLFEDATIEKSGHDLKFDTIVLAHHGITLAGLGVDTMLASYLLDATRSGHPLEGTALEHLGYKALTDEDVCGRGAKAVSFADVSPEAALNYAGERADLALQLADRLTPMLAAEGLDRVYRELERPLIPVLAAVERAGVRIDAAALASQSQHVERELAIRSDQIFERAGEAFNINSPQQLSRILFDKLQLPTLKRNVKTRTASTAVEVLEELALVHDLPRLILEWRALQKLKGTYIDALPQLVNPETGRVHTCFNQAVAATGRLSSSDPNLQNIPIRTELGREIRRAFIAEPGHLLISADYSQIEFRVLAHLRTIPCWSRPFARARTFTSRRRSRSSAPTADATRTTFAAPRRWSTTRCSTARRRSRLSKDIGVTQQVAQEFIDAYFAGFPSVRAFIDRTLEDARTTGVVKTMFGRRRLMPELTSRNGQIRQAAERQAVNLPIQGTAADIMKRAMIDVHAALETLPGARMILTVHDELLFEVPEARADEIAGVVRERMQEATISARAAHGRCRDWRQLEGSQAVGEGATLHVRAVPQSKRVRRTSSIVA